ncbi:PRKR-interacting protein 1 homolog [Haliotis rufescens]|uniref:PRKR-interacting protein 1 homolog n=1 Tax=Haliotis rufescens TaxID=6454 RepID=UPI00201E87E9|nr:PRKR-interacting protein 1 homolog [Haliotis rufescens]
MASKNEDKAVVIAKTPSELQRMRLDKLMKNPTKEVIIPDKSKDWNPRGPQEFIRNVWGSSAGAGSGDFHVYRGVRRREYARQKFITEKAKKDKQDVEYEKRVEENRKAADERTSKKRAKRMKKKKQKTKKPRKEEKKAESEESEDESDEEQDEDKNGQAEVRVEKGDNDEDVKR